MSVMFGMFDSCSGVFMLFDSVMVFVFYRCCSGLW